MDFSRQISRAFQDVHSYATRSKKNKVSSSLFPWSSHLSGSPSTQLNHSSHPDHRNRAYTTKPDDNIKEPSAAEEEQAHSHTNSGTDRTTRIIDPNIDYDKYPDWEVKENKVLNQDDYETPRGDMSDMYHPEGDFGISRPWLRPVWDVDAEEVDYSEEIAAWERQKEETGESIYIPPGKTIADLKWGRPLPDKDSKRK